MTHGPREWTLGRHTLRFESPDLFWMTFRGALTLEDVTRAVSLYQEMLEHRPFIFVAEMKELSRMEPEAGRYLSEHLPSSWFLGSIYVGARLLHRALAKGIMLASLLYPHGEERGLDKNHYVSTPEQARQLVLQLRARHRGG